jgi:CheY-like chemotaxis protein
MVEVMNILIAEDDPVSSRVLEATLQKWGYEVAVANNGVDAWEAMQGTTRTTGREWKPTFQITAMSSLVHGICPDCHTRVMAEVTELRNKRNGSEDLVF